MLAHLTDELDEHLAVTLVREAYVKVTLQLATLDLKGAFAVLFQIRHVLFPFLTTQVGCSETTLVRAVVGDSEAFELRAALRVGALFLATLTHHCQLCTDAVSWGSYSCHNLVSQRVSIGVLYTDPLTCKVPYVTVSSSYSQPR